MTEIEHFVTSIRTALICVCLYVGADSSGVYLQQILLVFAGYLLGLLIRDIRTGFNKGEIK